ncbi:SDR family NAD(P)-dependent oxidoreductase [Neptunomonas antarctica]|uniref:Short-chain dehydrogenase n=1 Tax=Neptunomonas antarctica TaxID=619304 RepID=A0A1N7LKJ0_9GAMM|nr:SDR family NAD(P)-dependent oxidoreductase [Neptunomonas antarctica]SIS74350.1 Short-chain dehydrogenase [Neptunomonas antarctica]
MNADKSILITGCSSGIGLQVALGLQERGYRVFASARLATDVAMLQQRGLEACQLDLDDSCSIEAAVDWLLTQTGGTLYALFNNGAYGQPGAVEDLSRDVLRQQFETNLFGTLELTNLLIPVMRRQGYGRIIQNSSVLGLISMKYRGAYNASKFALEGLTDTLRQELHGSGIFVSLVEPGPISSDFRKNAYTKFKQNIVIEGSAHQRTYEAVEKRLAAQPDPEKKDPFTLGPEAVLKRVIHALEAKKPKARYYVTVPTYLFAYLRRLLSANMLDLVLRRAADSENK